VISARFEQSRERPDPIAQLLADYRPLQGVYDEMMTARCGRTGRSCSPAL
jgi:hypothetical protein